MPSDDERLRLKDIRYIFPRKYMDRRTPLSDAIDDVARFLIEKDKSLGDCILTDDLMKLVVGLARIRSGETNG